MSTVAVDFSRVVWPLLNRSQLRDDGSFAVWTLEQFVDALRLFSDAAWIEALTDRYLAFDKTDQLLAATGD